MDFGRITFRTIADTGILLDTVYLGVSNDYFNDAASIVKKKQD